jgi:hypothetical protein
MRSQAPGGHQIGLALSGGGIRAIRRSAKVIATQWLTSDRRHNMADGGWDAAAPLTFSNKVKSWD